MSAFDLAMKRASREQLKRNGQAVTYRGPGEEVTTVGIIDLSMDLFGEGTQVGDDRWQCALLVEDVAKPHRGDRVIDESGDTWVLQEEQPIGDRWMTVWSVTKR